MRAFDGFPRALARVPGNIKGSKLPNNYFNNFVVQKNIKARCSANARWQLVIILLLICNDTSCVLRKLKASSLLTYYAHQRFSFMPSLNQLALGERKRSFPPLYIGTSDHSIDRLAFIHILERLKVRFDDFFFHIRIVDRL